jgi:transcription elongation GreA/GreB family factor
MKEEIDQLVSAGKILPKHVAPLVALIEAGYCQHKSWGFGRIKTVDAVDGKLVVDFIGKTGHPLELQFAVESLKPIGKTHIFARKYSELESLRKMAALHHLDVVKIVIESFGGKATVDQIQNVLVPDVIQSDWKKWWEAARTELKKDGHFQIPIKKAEPIVYQQEEKSLADRLAADFRAAKGLKARITVAAEMLKSVEDLKGHNVLAASIASLNADIASHFNTMPSLALEGIFMRDELRNAAGLPPTEGEIPALAIWGQNPKLKDLFEEMPVAKHRRTLESFRDLVPEWANQIVAILNGVPAKLAGECAKILLQENRGQLLKDTLARLISRHEAGSELLLWFGKERNDYFADLLTPEVFRAMMTSIERDQFNEKKSNRLRDFILEDQGLLPDLIQAADIEIIKDLVRTLQLSASFDDMDKRSLLARVVKQYPVIQSMITGDTAKQDNTFLVSWPSLERRKIEYEDVVQKRIPANVKDIALARSYGDLRENHEYKAAKEMQKVLNRRKHELELMLSRARGMDFATVRSETAGPGTYVTLTDLESGKMEHVAILGAWDGDPDRNIVNYLTPLAQSLMNKPVGTEVEFKTDGAKRRLRLEAVAPVPPELLPVSVPVSEVPVAAPEEPESH